MSNQYNPRTMNRKEVTWKEMCKSETAKRYKIENNPDGNSIVNLEALIEYIVKPIYDKFPTAEVTSGYRCEKLNDKVGGVKGSQHTKGQAVDLVLIIPDKNLEESIKELYNFIACTLPFDQMIIHHTYIHVSYRAINRRLEVINKAPNIYREIPIHFYL